MGRKKYIWADNNVFCSPGDDSDMLRLRNAGEGSKRRMSGGHPSVAPVQCHRRHRISHPHRCVSQGLDFCEKECRWPIIVETSDACRVSMVLYHCYHTEPAPLYTLISCYGTIIVRYSIEVHACVCVCYLHINGSTRYGAKCVSRWSAGTVAIQYSNT